MGTLFCLPYAGGSATVYLKWKRHIQNVELVPIELTGRGLRSGIGFYQTFSAAIDDVYNLIRHSLKSPYAVFGHSMGGLMAYELCHRIKKDGGPQPVHLFLSACKAPHLSSTDKPLHRMPDRNLIEEVFKLGGTPPEILNNDTLLSFFIPVLRADYRIVETYKYVEKDELLECDISLLSGEQDDISVEDLNGWQKHTKGKLNIFRFQGGHFFIHDHISEITALVNRTLEKYIEMEAQHGAFR